jgi:phospholipase D1/2
MPHSTLSANTMWSHHEKIVVVDQLVAFVGGLDLALMRYDTPQHQLTDTGKVLFKGQDYCNPRASDFDDVADGAKELHDRNVMPRMPWQDVQTKLYGTPALDVSRHFVLRWNYTRRVLYSHTPIPVLTMLGKNTLYNSDLSPHRSRQRAVDAASDPMQWPQESNPHGPMRVQAQVVRSISRWSAGTKLEASIHTAYLDLIVQAKRFVYIENQFFCSGMYGNADVGNRLSDAILQRIRQAHTQGEDFHVMVVMPVCPAICGPLDRSTTKPATLMAMSWQYKTICRGNSSLYARLRTEGGIKDPSKYLSFFALRGWAELGGQPVTEQVYVHSKVCVCALCLCFG